MRRSATWPTIRARSPCTTSITTGRAPSGCCGESIAGDVTINDTILHIAQPELPFGGAGASGMGRYHGEEGFNTFSQRKGVFLQSRLNTTWLLKPPFGRRIERILRLICGEPSPTPLSRPREGG